MKEFTLHRRKGLSEMRPYEEGEDLKDVSISKEDAIAGSPKVGDWIARNPKNHLDQWLVAKNYYDDNLEPFNKETTFLERLHQEYNELGEKTDKLRKFLYEGEYPELIVGELQYDLLQKQYQVMEQYRHILKERLEDLESKTKQL